MAKKKRGYGARLRSRARRFGRRARKTMGNLFSMGGGSDHPIVQVLKKPVTKGIAPAIGLAALLQLAFTPLSNGDSWLGRVLSGMAAFKAGGGKDATLLLATDPDGNNAFTIAANQLVQNALPAAVTGLTAGVVYKFGKWLGL